MHRNETEEELEIAKAVYFHQEKDLSLEVSA